MEIDYDNDTPETILLKRLVELVRDEFDHEGRSQKNWLVFMAERARTVDPATTLDHSRAMAVMELSLYAKLYLESRENLARYTQRIRTRATLMPVNEDR